MRYKEEGGKQGYDRSEGKPLLPPPPPEVRRPEGEGHQKIHQTSIEEVDNEVDDVIARYICATNGIVQRKGEIADKTAGL
jgi:hypothetical protein